MADDFDINMGDDYYDSGFEDYQTSTRDPGPWMLIGVCIYSAFCVILLPILVHLGRSMKKKREARITTEILKDSFDLGLIVGTKVENLEEGGRAGDVFVASHPAASPGGNSTKKLKRTKGKKYSALGGETIEMHVDVPYNINTLEGENRIVETENSFADDEGVKSTQKRNCAATFLAKNSDMLIDIAKFDRETRRLIKLGTPFTASEVSEALFDALMILLISRYLHVYALSAYVVTNLLIGLSVTFIEGIGESLHTLCSHAIGADNYKLAGQYAQISTILYTALSVPILGCWWFLMESCLELFGLNESSVDIGTKYTKAVMFHYFAEGVCDAGFALLDVSGHEMHTMIFCFIARVLSFILTWVMLATVDGFDLFWVGVIQCCTSVLFFSTFLAFATCLGWFTPFWQGMTRTCALKNTQAVSNVLRTALPLSLGTLLEYGEWQLLTIFAATLGPAEVAAWGIMEAIWDLFEAATEGFAEAGSIRLAYHLGRGNIESSIRSAWKSLLLTTSLAIIITVIFFICGDYVAGWFTEDETLKGMINSMIPLVGFGNIFMAFGSVSWSLVGAQGRFKLATTISAFMSICVTIPLAAISCIALKFELDGLVASMVVGYTTTSLCMAYVLLMSDWESISDRIIEDNTDSDDDSDSEDEEDIPSSSSSSSSESSSSSSESSSIEDLEDCDTSKVNGTPLAEVVSVSIINSNEVIPVSAVDCSGSTSSSSVSSQNTT